MKRPKVNNHARREFIAFLLKGQKREIRKAFGGQVSGPLKYRQSYLEQRSSDVAR
jgi:hypothetical protein